MGYRIELKTWQVRGEEAKEKLLARKKAVQIAFFEKLGLRVDFPKDSGSGTSNDGNTARRAFREPFIFSEITRVDTELIKRLANILWVVNSFRKINLTTFSTAWKLINYFVDCTIGFTCLHRFTSFLYIVQKLLRDSFCLSVCFRKRRKNLGIKTTRISD